MSQSWFYFIFSDNDSTVGSAVKFYVLISLGQTDRQIYYTHRHINCVVNSFCVECSFSATSAGHFKLLQKICIAKLLNYVL